MIIRIDEVFGRYSKIDDLLKKNTKKNYAKFLMTLITYDPIILLI